MDLLLPNLCSQCLIKMVFDTSFVIYLDDDKDMEIGDKFVYVDHDDIITMRFTRVHED